MIVEIPNGVVVDITTLLGAAETAEIALESNFDTSLTIYLTLAATPPTSTDECEATLQPLRSSPFCQRRVTGEAGSKVYAMTAFNPSNETVKIRASEA